MMFQWDVFDLSVMWEASLGSRVVRVDGKMSRVFFKEVIRSDYGKPWVGSCLSFVSQVWWLGKMLHKS